MQSFINHDVCYNQEKENVKIESCKQTVRAKRISHLLLLLSGNYIGKREISRWFTKDI